MGALRLNSRPGVSARHKMNSALPTQKGFAVYKFTSNTRFNYIKMYLPGCHGMRPNVLRDVYGDKLSDTAAPDRTYYMAEFVWPGLRWLLNSKKKMLKGEKTPPYCASYPSCERREMVKSIKLPSLYPPPIHPALSLSLILPAQIAVTRPFFRKNDWLIQTPSGRLLFLPPCCRCIVYLCVSLISRSSFGRWCWIHCARPVWFGYLSLWDGALFAAPMFGQLYPFVLRCQCNTTTNIHSQRMAPFSIASCIVITKQTKKGKII